MMQALQLEDPLRLAIRLRGTTQGAAYHGPERRSAASLATSRSMSSGPAPKAASFVGTFMA